MNDNHDEQGRFAATTMLGAHDKMDKLAANAHAKAEAVKPPKIEVLKHGKKAYVTNKSDGVVTSHNSMSEANRHADKLKSSYSDRQKDYHAERANRATRAAGYMRERSGRDAKYGKQLKFNF